MQQAELRKLLNKMTIEEKIGQTIQLASHFFLESEENLTGPMNEMKMTVEKKYQVGSVLGLTGAENTIEIQKEYLKKSRLHIPLLFMADIIHGDHTIFPIPLGLGATWNAKLVKETAQVSASESAVQGLHITFSPMVDLVRDPRWGRVLETTGEDKYLNKIFAKAFVEGYQGEDLKNDLTKVGACVKHFAGYGAPRGGRDYNTVDLAENTFREHYLPAYKEGIDAGAKLVMASFNTVDNIPATGNKRLMRDILRKEMNFDGVLISDWGSVGELVPHGVAVDMNEAAQLALEAGVDIEMMTAAYSEHLKSLVETDTHLKELLNDAVWRILSLKNDLGLFENPYRGADIEKEKTKVFTKENKKVALKVAEASMVLLENNGVLPLKEQQKIVLTGPMKKTNDLLGAWSWKGDRKETRSFAEELKEFLPENTLSIIEESELFYGSKSYSLQALKESDTIIVALGETSEMSGEAASRTTIKLPENQILLLQEISKLNKKVIVTLFNGRPLDLSDIVPLSDAIVEAWFPGTKGAEALVNLLYGKITPSGKLPMTFPRSVGQIPIFYNQDSTGRPLNEGEQSNKYLSRYLDSENSPLYPFGYGLSYTTFDYSDLSLSSHTMKKDGKIQVSVTVKNTGEINGVETVQLYIRDEVGKVVRPVKELIDFKQITLDPEEEKTVIFDIFEEQLRYTQPDNSHQSDEGKFQVGIGTNSDIELTNTFELIR